MFHLWEHRTAERSLIRLARAMQLDATERKGEILSAHDWRSVNGGAGTLRLKRAFNPQTPADVARYATPVILLCALMLATGSTLAGAVYLLALCVKYFLSETVVAFDTDGVRYRVEVFGKRLFGSSLEDRTHS